MELCVNEPSRYWDSTPKKRALGIVEANVLYHSLTVVGAHGFIVRIIATNLSPSSCRFAEDLT
jgi:hypothetical protein